MTGTINLVDQLFQRGIRYQQQQQNSSAIRVFKQLNALASIGPHLKSQAQGRLGLLYLKQRKYRQARRHLQAALQLHRQDAWKHHLLLGLAWAYDRVAGCVHQARRHFTEALRQKPHSATLRGVVGLALVHAGEYELGTDWLRQALTEVPMNGRVLRRAVRGLFLAGQVEEAKQTVLEALFRHPRNEDIRRLYSQLRLAITRQEQQRESFSDEQPILLPFVRLISERLDEPRAVREDDAETLPGPHLMRMRLRRGRRRAP